MICSQLASTDVLPLSLQDTVADALLIAEKHGLSALPVVDAEKYLGMIGEEDLLDEDPSTRLELLADRFSGTAVRPNDYFLVAVKVSYVYGLTGIPVVNDRLEWEGMISQSQLFTQLAKLTGAEEFGSLIVLEMDKSAYAPGLFNRLVESNDAMITQLNSQTDTTTGITTVVIRINKEEISDVVASFQRHDFTVRHFMGEELFRNELQNNLEHLLNYLNI